MINDQFVDLTGLLQASLIVFDRQNRGDLTRRAGRRLTRRRAKRSALAIWTRDLCVTYLHLWIKPDTCGDTLSDLQEQAPIAALTFPKYRLPR